jgi:ribosome hibernation promoting factor
MRIEYTFRNLEASETVKDHAAEKLGKLQKYFRAPLDAEVTFSSEKHQFTIDVSVTADGLKYLGREESEDLYNSVDKVVNKIRTQVTRNKSASAQRRRTYPPIEQT